MAAEAITHSDAQEVHQLLANELREAQAAADFKAKCQQVFRWAEGSENSVLITADRRGTALFFKCKAC